MKTLEQLNNLVWHEVLEKENLDELAQQAYRLHQQQNLLDVEFIGNKPPPDLDFDRNKMMPDRFDGYSNGYNRATVPVATAASEISYYEFEQNHAVTQLIKNTFNLNQTLVRYNFQKPGQMIAVHVDYNRGMLRAMGDIAHSLIAKNLQKYIWFLQDQQIGQMFAVGRENLSWRAGDVVSWPWYMPHATANASDHNRSILFIAGF